MSVNIPFLTYDVYSSHVPQVVHGLSVPIGKLGYRLPRTWSSRIGSRTNSRDPEEPDDPFRIRDRVRSVENTLHADKGRQANGQRMREEPARPVFRIGGSVIQSGVSTPGSRTIVNGNQDDFIDRVQLGDYQQRSESGAVGEEPESPNQVANEDAGAKGSVINEV